MPYKSTPPKSIAVGYHPSLEEARSEADEICAYLREQGVEMVACASLYDPDLRQSLLSGNFDVLIALGGDGTMLRAGRLGAALGLPVLGINAGNFGFLTEVQRDQWREALPLLLQGKYRLEERMMLRAEHWRAGKLLDAWDVLNEVVVSRGKFVRPIQLSASVDGYFMSTYTADGLIVSTPTGSTAYALAVGGPIMPPELRNILIIPVAPHLSIDRGIILPKGVQVSIRVATHHEAVISVDGHAPVLIETGDTVKAYAGDHTAAFVRFQDPSYFYRNLTMYLEQNPAANSTP